MPLNPALGKHRGRAMSSRLGWSTHGFLVSQGPIRETLFLFCFKDISSQVWWFILIILVFQVAKAGELP